jgi:drug/metabolite transporter (DMT)-like permease
MIWIYIVVIAQFINAVVTLVDKSLIITRTIREPVAYTFYVGGLSAVVILLVPFGLVLMPSAAVLSLSLMAGLSFTFALLLLFESLKISDASDVAPVFGLISTIATLIFSTVALGSRLSGNFTIAAVLMICGMLLMSYFRLSWRASVFLLIGGVLFGLSSVFIKDIFNQTTFWNGFFWSRIMVVPTVLLFLLRPVTRSAIFASAKESSLSTKFTLVMNKALAGLASVLVLYSIKLGEVSIVNALSSLQFVFLLLIAVIFTKKFPEYFNETIHERHAILHKSLATGLIIAGFILLFI